MTYYDDGYHRNVEAWKDRAYVADTRRGLVVLDITGEVSSPVTPLMVDEMDELSPEHFREVARRRRAHFDRHRDLLEELKTAGRLRDVDTTVATFGLLALISRVFGWFDPAGRLTGEEVALEVTKLALGALLEDPAPVIAELARLRSARA